MDLNYCFVDIGIIAPSCPRPVMVNLNVPAFKYFHDRNKVTYKMEIFSLTHPDWNYDFSFAEVWVWEYTLLTRRRLSPMCSRALGLTSVWWRMTLSYRRYSSHGRSSLTWRQWFSMTENQTLIRRMSTRYVYVTDLVSTWCWWWHASVSHVH